MTSTVTLKDYAGQQADVIIITRDDNSQHVIFKWRSNYGYPSLERRELETLLSRMDQLRGME